MRCRSWVALLMLFGIPCAAATDSAMDPGSIPDEQAASRGALTRFQPGPNGTLVRQVLPSRGMVDAPRVLARTSVVPTSDPWVWLDTHPWRIADFVAVSGDGLHAIAGWGFNQQQVTVYRTVRDPIEFARLLPAGEWFVNVDADEHGEHLLAASLGESLYVLSSRAGRTIASHDYPYPYKGWWCATSADGSTYASASRNFETHDGSIVQVYGAAHELRFMRGIETDYPLGVNVSADGSVVCANGYDIVKVWDAHTGALLDSIPVPECISSSAPAVLSGDGRRLAIGTLQGAQVRLYQWDGIRYAPLWVHAMEGATWVTALAISRDGRTLAAGTITIARPEDGSVGVWNTESPEPLWRVPTYGGGCFSIALAADGSALVAGYWAELTSQSGNIVQIWNRESSVPIWHASFDPTQGVGSCESVDISSDGGFVMASGKATHAEVWGAGGWVMAIQTPGRPVPIGFQVTPSMLAPWSRGRWVTALLQPPPPFSAARIFIPSIQLNGTLGVAPDAPWELGDANGDGIQDLQVKFPRDGVQAFSTDGGRLALRVTGWMRDRDFVGDDSIGIAGRAARDEQQGSTVHTLALRIVSPVRMGAVKALAELPSTRRASVDVFDITGRVVLAETLVPGAAGALELPLSGLRKPGLYWIRLRQGSQLVTARTVILR